MVTHFLCRNPGRLALGLALVLGWVVGATARGAAADTPPPLDPVRVRELVRRTRNGETLSREDPDYLTYAREQIRQRTRQSGSPGQGGWLLASKPKPRGE